MLERFVHAYIYSYANDMYHRFGVTEAKKKKTKKKGLVAVGGLPIACLPDVSYDGLHGTGILELGTLVLRTHAV